LADELLEVGQAATRKREIGNIEYPKKSDRSDRKQPATGDPILRPVNQRDAAAL
jgi:hypothetical protein